MKTNYEKNKIKIKICGIKKVQTVKKLIDLSVNYYGLIFFEKSPRYIDLENANNLIKFSKDSKIEPVGVFVNYKLNKIQKYIDKLNLKFIQLHGNENDNYIKSIKKNNNIKIIKVINIRVQKDLEDQKNYSHADFFLFDYKPNKINEMPGGNAKKFNWDLLKNSKLSKKWFISGGINRYNIKEAINLKNPYGIDVSSGVEDKPGEKSIKKITNLIKIIKTNED